MSMELNNPFNDNSLYINWAEGTTPYDDLGVNMGSPGLVNSNYTSVPSLSVPFIQPLKSNFISFFNSCNFIFSIKPDTNK